MDFLYQKTITAITALLVFVSSYSQDTTKDLVSVKLDIIGKDAIAQCKDASTFYLATVTIVNTQDTAITFWLMDSWPEMIFVTNTDSIFFCSCRPGYDADQLDKITLAPKKAAEFYCTIKSFKKDLSTAAIRAGFRYFKTSEDVYFFDTRDRHKKKYKVYWSNAVEWKDKMYTYEVDR